MVAVVPITPIFPVRVAFAAAWAVGATTPVNGTAKHPPKSPATELTVPQAAMIYLTFWIAGIERPALRIS